MKLSQRAVSRDFAPPGGILHRLQIPLYPDDPWSLGQIADFWEQQFLQEFRTVVLCHSCLDGSGGRGWTERSEGSPKVSGYRPMALSL